MFWSLIGKFPVFYSEYSVKKPFSLSSYFDLVNLRKVLVGESAAQIVSMMYMKI
jgi:hypothetical protein